MTLQSCGLSHATSLKVGPSSFISVELSDVVWLNSLARELTKTVKNTPKVQLTIFF